MTNITAIHEAKTVTTTSALKAASKTKVSSPIEMQSAPKSENIKELSPKQLQAKMDMEEIIADKLGFKGLFKQNPYISANIKNENGKWIVNITKETERPWFVGDWSAKQYEISHICGQLGVKMDDLRNVEYATNRRTRRGDSTIEVGRSVQFDLDKLGSRKDMPLSNFYYNRIADKAKKTIEILSTK